MVSPAYIADQVILAIFFVAMTVLYALQLVVEHRAKYDEQQLNEQQRVEDWRVAVTKRGKLPVSPRRTSAADRDEDSSTSTLQSDQADRDRTITVGGAPKQKRTLRVGRMQWWFHRLGFIAGLLQSIRYIDPYGVHGIYTYQQLSFINLNCQAVIYTMGMLACFFPLTLVRAVALRERSRTIEIIGITLSICTFVVFNVVVGLYSVFDVKNWLRGVLSLWLSITLFFAVGAFNISSIRLIKALRQLMSVQTVTHAKDVPVSPRADSPVPAAEMSPMSANYSNMAENTEDGPGPAVNRQNTESDNGGSAQELSLSSSKANLLSDKPSSPSAGARALPPTAEHSSPPSPAAQPRSSISAVNFASTALPISAFKAAPRGVVKQYKRMIRKLKQFLIACDFGVLVIATSITVVGIGQVRDAESVYEITSSYSQAAGQLVVNIAQAVLLLVFYWYAYMPLSTIFSCLEGPQTSSDDEEPKRPSREPQPRDNRQRPSIQATLNFSAPVSQSSTDAV